MTRHLSLVAFIFGLVTTTSFAVATSLHQTAAKTASSVRFVELERVTITARRLAPEL